MSYAGDLRAVVRHRDFRRLFATRLTSQAADGGFQAALASLFFFSPERQTSAGSVAAAFAVLLLPYSVVGPFAGVLLDRWRRRQILVVANLLRAAMVLGVAELTFADVGGVPLYVAVLACLSVNRFFLAGLGASLPHVVPPERLVIQDRAITVFNDSGEAWTGVEIWVNERYVVHLPKVEREKLLEQMMPEDLLKFGLIPEFVGRLPVIVSLSALTRDDLMRILIEPKNAVTKQFRRLFDMEGADLEFRDEALRATGFTILRFENHEVLDDLPAAVGTIARWVDHLRATGVEPE